MENSINRRTTHEESSSQGATTSNSNGLKHGILNDGSANLVLKKRRQTFSDGRATHTTPSKASQSHGKRSQQSQSQQKSHTDHSHHHHHHPPHHRHSIGPAASSYYFKGAPKTPVQRMVRAVASAHSRGGDSSDKKAASLLVAPAATALTSSTPTMTMSSSQNENAMNTSYLSSSSSSDSEDGMASRHSKAMLDTSLASRRTNSDATTTTAYEHTTGGHSSNSSSPNNDTLNQSTLSDTTELTVSNFFTLAASRRMPLESSSPAMARTSLDGHRDVATASQRPVLGDLTVPVDTTALERRRRRTTLAVVMPAAHQETTVIAAPPSRQSLPPPLPTSATTTTTTMTTSSLSSPTVLANLVQTMKNQRAQRRASSLGEAPDLTEDRSTTNELRPKDGTDNDEARPVVRANGDDTTMVNRQAKDAPMGGIVQAVATLPTAAIGVSESQDTAMSTSSPPRTTAITTNGISHPELDPSSMVSWMEDSPARNTRRRRKSMAVRYDDTNEDTVSAKNDNNGDTTTLSLGNLLNTEAESSQPPVHDATSTAESTEAGNTDAMESNGPQQQNQQSLDKTNVTPPTMTANKSPAAVALLREMDSPARNTRSSSRKRRSSVCTDHDETTVSLGNLFDATTAASSLENGSVVAGNVADNDVSTMEAMAPPCVQDSICSDDLPAPVDVMKRSLPDNTGKSASEPHSIKNNNTGAVSPENVSDNQSSKVTAVESDDVTDAMPTEIDSQISLELTINDDAVGDMSIEAEPTFGDSSDNDGMGLNVEAPDGDTTASLGNLLDDVRAPIDVESVSLANGGTLFEEKTVDTTQGVDRMSESTTTMANEPTSAQKHASTSTPKLMKSPARKLIDSPARNTRSSAKRRAYEVDDGDNTTIGLGHILDDVSISVATASVDDSSEKDQQEISPDRIVRHGTLKKRKSLGGMQLIDSPARNTRSSTSKASITTSGASTPEVGTSVIHGDLNTTDETTASLGKFLDDVPILNENERCPMQHHSGPGDESMTNQDSTVSTSTAKSPAVEDTSLLPSKNQNTTLAPLDSQDQSTHSQKRLSTHTTNETAVNSLPISIDKPKEDSPYSTRKGQQKLQELLNMSLGSDVADTSCQNVSTGDSTGSIGDLLDDLPPSQRQNETSRTNDSTISLGDILSDVPLSQEFNGEEANETSEIGDLLSDQTPKHSGDNGGPDMLSLAQNSAASSRSCAGSTSHPSSVSRASVLTTPGDMAHHNESSTATVQGDVSSPPSTIRIVGATIFSATSNVGKSPYRKALTPSKLAPSPRRLINMGTYKASPFKKSLTPSRLPSTPVRLRNSIEVRQDTTSLLKRGLTPTKLAPSPMRPTSDVASNTEKAGVEVEKDADLNTHSSKTIPSSAIKRQSTFEHLQQSRLPVNDSATTIELTADLRTNDSLQSVLRRPGSRLRSNNRVVFGSPEMAEFNKGSPSMRLTPMPKLKASFYQDLPEDTVELEHDMKALFEEKGIKQYTQESAGNTPFASTSLSRVGNQRAPENESYMEDILEKETDDSNMSMDSPTIGHTPVDQENTVELECNMAELLGDALDGSTSSDDEPLVPENLNEEPNMEDEVTMELESDMKDILNNDINLSVSNQSRRSSTSSRRFSLVPATASRLSLSVDGNLVEEGGVLQDSRFLVDQSTGMSVEASSLLPPHLKFGDILSPLDLHNGTNSVSEDLLVGVNHVLKEFDVSEGFNALLVQVKQAVVEQTESEIDFDATMEDSDENGRNYFAIQKAFRSEANGSVVHGAQKVVEQVQMSSANEWLQWLLPAFKQLEAALDESIGALASGIQARKDVSKEIEMMLTSMNGKVERRARRRSIDERKNKINSLEHDILEMEEELARSKRYLRDTTLEKEKYSTQIGDRNTNIVLKRDQLETRSTAETEERRYAIIKGLTNWKPETLNNEELKFLYIGQSPNTCLALSFRILKDNVACEATFQHDVFKQHQTHTNHLAKVSEFIQCRTETLCRSLNTMQLNKPYLISALLRSLQLKLGRLEHTARELVTLKRRYRAVLAPSQLKTSDNFQLEVEFLGQSSLANLRATFELTEEYPFAPLNVRLDALDHEINVDTIRKLLLKNAKPGFGYLSRTCDVIAAYIGL